MKAAEVAPARDPAPRVPRARLLRSPLLWAAAAAIAGAAIGLTGTLAQAALWESLYVEPSTQLLADATQHVGEALAALSLAGVAYLLWTVHRWVGRCLAVAGVAQVSLLLVAETVGVSSALHRSMGGGWDPYAPSLFFGALEQVASYAIVFLPPAVCLPFAVAAFLSREARLGTLLCGLYLLALPFFLLQLWLFPPDPGAYAGPSHERLFLVLGWYPWGVSLPEALLWALLGVALLRRARERTRGEAFRTEEKKNLEAARRLYEEGLGQGDLSVVDDLVCEDFRDLRRGTRGKLGMERVITGLRDSYPDLDVSVEGQEAEGTLVRTRLLLSGTDRGGVLWYPPTGRRATFAAEFTDRFSGGRLVEHAGEADTRGLLRQLGLAETEGPGR